MLLLPPKIDLRRPRGPRTLVSWTPGACYNESRPEKWIPTPTRRSLFRRWRDTFWKRPVDAKNYKVTGSNALVSQQAAGTLFNTYTTAKRVLPDQAIYNIPAGDQFWYVGKMLRITVWGGLSNIVTTPGTVTMQVMLGPTGSIVVFTTGAVQLNATAHVLLPFQLTVLMTLQVLGSGTTSKFMGGGQLQGIHFTKTAGQVDDVNTPGIFSVPATAPAQGGGFDSSVVNILDFWNGFSINDANNGIQVQQYLVEELN